MFQFMINRFRKLQTGSVLANQTTGLSSFPCNKRLIEGNRRVNKSDMKYQHFQDARNRQRRIYTLRTLTSLQHISNRKLIANL